MLGQKRVVSWASEFYESKTPPSLGPSSAEAIAFEMMGMRHFS